MSCVFVGFSCRSSAAGSPKITAGVFGFRQLQRVGVTVNDGYQTPIKAGSV